MSPENLSPKIRNTLLAYAKYWQMHCDFRADIESRGETSISEAQERVLQAAGDLASFYDSQLSREEDIIMTKVISDISDIRWTLFYIADCSKNPS